jgi:hypothetical protein
VNLWLNLCACMAELVNYELIMLVVACGYQLIIYMLSYICVGVIFPVV